MKKSYLVAFLVIGAALGFTLWAFSSSMTPYVNIKQARISEGVVQVTGKILHAPPADDPRIQPPYFDAQTGTYRFWIEDENRERIEIVYHGGKPDSFDTAPRTAATGRIRNGVFESNSLVVQCPSRYDSKEKAANANSKTASAGGSY